VGQEPLHPRELVFELRARLRIAVGAQSARRSLRRAARSVENIPACARAMPQAANLVLVVRSPLGACLIDRYRCQTIHGAALAHAGPLWRGKQTAPMKRVCKPNCKRTARQQPKESHGQCANNAGCEPRGFRPICETYLQSYLNAA
jgi:hypothetical protein